MDNSSGQTQGYATAGEYDTASDFSTAGAYTPSEIQTEIDTLINQFVGPNAGAPGYWHAGVMTEYQSMCIMYLMQSYGGAVTNQDAIEQGVVNNYLGAIQNLWNDVHESDPAANPNATDQTSAFCDQITGAGGIIAQMNADPFFAQHKDMLASITSELTGMVSTVTADGGLEAMWNSYSPSGDSTSGVPASMNVLMQSLGQTNQQFTGESQAVAADTKSDVSTLQTEQTAMSNFASAIKNMVKLMNDNFRTG